jgi:hypothetical protein
MINSKLGGFIMSVDAAQIKFIQYLDIKMRRLLSKGRDIASVQSEFNKYLQVIYSTIGSMSPEELLKYRSSYIGFDICIKILENLDIENYFKSQKLNDCLWK